MCNRRTTGRWGRSDRRPVHCLPVAASWFRAPPRSRGPLRRPRPDDGPSELAPGSGGSCGGLRAPGRSQRALVTLACEITAWMQMPALSAHPARRWDQKTAAAHLLPGRPARPHRAPNRAAPVRACRVNAHVIPQACAHVIPQVVGPVMMFYRIASFLASALRPGRVLGR
jgi:hypothetical protein